jgi:hypothetical protein
MTLNAGTTRWTLTAGSATFCATALAENHGSPVQSATTTFRQVRGIASRRVNHISGSTISLASATELATQVRVAAIPMDLGRSSFCKTYSASTTVSGYLAVEKELTGLSAMLASVAKGSFGQPSICGLTESTESVPGSGLYGRGGY